jgi:rhodanese-related sulfurtransferase
MKSTLLRILIVLVVSIPSNVFALDTKSGEKEYFTEMRSAIPADRVKNVDDLYQKWQEIESGKSQAILIDLRTEAEFDSGHIKDSNNIDSGHAYTLPGKWADPETEIWVFCRTAHRATYFAGLLYKYGYKNIYLVDKGIVGWFEKGYPLFNTYLGEIKVTKYDKKLKEIYAYRENK